MSDDLLPDVEMPPAPPEEPLPEVPEVMDKDCPPPPAEKPEEQPEKPEEEEEEPPPPPVVKPVIEDDHIFKDVPKKPKRKASKKQLEHLAKAREKATAKRKEQEAERTALKKEKQVREAVKVVKSPEQPKGIFLTKEEILNLQSEAIEGHETKRKARKQVKKKEQEEVQKVNRANKVIRRAVGQPDPDDIWADCFR